MQILYNACKNTSCKIIHATHAKQGATKKLNKADENCEIKQPFYGQLLLFCNWKTKINFSGGATTNYKKINVRGFTYFTYQKTVKFTILSTLGRVWGSCLEYL